MAPGAPGRPRARSLSDTCWGLGAAAEGPGGSAARPAAPRGHTQGRRAPTEEPRLPGAREAVARSHVPASPGAGATHTATPRHRAQRPLPDSHARPQFPGLRAPRHNPPVQPVRRTEGDEAGHPRPAGTARAHRVHRVSRPRPPNPLCGCAAREGRGQDLLPRLRTAAGRPLPALGALRARLSVGPARVPAARVAPWCAPPAPRPALRRARQLGEIGGPRAERGRVGPHPSGR